MMNPELQDDFDEQIASFFNRAPSKAEAEAELAAHSQQLLEQLPQMGEVLEDYPAYAALALHGRLQFCNKSLISRLSRAGTSAEAAIDAIRAHKALRVAASAKGGWDFLLAHHLDTLWSAIQLNALGRKPQSDDPDTEEDEEDLYSEEDDWNDEEEDDDDNHS